MSEYEAESEIELNEIERQRHPLVWAADVESEEEEQTP